MIIIESVGQCTLIFHARFSACRRVLLDLCKKLREMHYYYDWPKGDFHMHECIIYVPLLWKPSSEFSVRRCGLCVILDNTLLVMYLRTTISNGHPFFLFLQWIGTCRSTQLALKMTDDTNARWPHWDPDMRTWTSGRPPKILSLRTDLSLKWKKASKSNSLALQEMANLRQK